MTLLLDRRVAGPKTHAFIIGVGRYPSAKEGKGIQANLREVPDLPSAADGAKLMCDWLLESQDKLAAPLATLEVLISDAEESSNRYSWDKGPVEAATETNVAGRGLEWFGRLAGEPGSVAFFYCCGHGASHVQAPVLFLEDLNKNPVNVWSHINLGLLAHSLRKTQSVSAAFLFSDACGQYVTEFELVGAPDVKFFHQASPFGASRNQVSLLCAAAEAQLAYEDTVARGSSLKFGRFTQTILKGLSGASVRWCDSKWGVHPHGLLADLKSLRRVYFDHWADTQPFEPYQAVTPTDPIPIVFTGDAAEVPFVIITDPAERMAEYALYISDRNDPSPPWLKSRDAGDSKAWVTSVSAGRVPLYAIAANDAKHFNHAFVPSEPLFKQSVSVR